MSHATQLHNRRYLHDSLEISILRFPIACCEVTAEREEFEKPWFLIMMRFSS
jgi:hypothetical protein